MKNKNMEEALDRTFLVLSKTLQILSWVASLPLRLLAVIITWVRAKRYDPEKIVTPCCRFKGDSGTAGKSCSISFMRVMDQQKIAMIQHTCFRCGCKEIFTPLAYDGKKWLKETSADQLKQFLEGRG